MLSSALMLMVLRAKLLALTTLLAFLVGEPLARWLQIDRLALALHRLAMKLAKKLNRPSRSIGSRVYRGIIVTAVLVLPAFAFGRLLDGAGIPRLLVVLLLVVLSGRGFNTTSLFRRWRMARRGKLILESEDKLFGDTHGVLRHLIRQSAEGFASSVIGAGLWFVIGGFALMLPYLATALAYERYTTGREADKPFAWAATTLYRLADALPRLLASILLILSGFFAPGARPLRALRSFTLNEQKWYGLVADLLGISLGGRVYRLGGELNLPWLGKGSAKLTSAALFCWMAVLSTASLLFVILLSLPAYLPVLH